MAQRQIIYADNPRLREKSKKVRVFGPGLQTLIEDMVETMHEANGQGLAAPQVDVLERVIVIEIPEDEEDPQSGKLFALVNPEIVRAEGEEEGKEGCLSIPGWWGEVKRATFVTVKAQDAKGKWIRLKAYDLPGAGAAARNRPPGRHLVHRPRRRPRQASPCRAQT